MKRGQARGKQDGRDMGFAFGLMGERERLQWKG